jgi:hypothetical protein
MPTIGPPEETALVGGTANVGQVVRIDDTVHRPQTPASPAVHAVLLYLEKVGFDGAPRYLGQDDQGREVLSYLEGDVPTSPYPPWAFADDVLAGVARLLRRYHAAVRGFDPAGHTWLTSVPAAYRTGLVSHNDPNLDNVVFRNRQAVALLDFDLASPGSAMWDLALATRLWVPLRDPVDLPEVPDDLAHRRLQRIRLIADSYGLEQEKRRQLAVAAGETHSWCYGIVRAGAEAGRSGYAAYWEAGGQARNERGRRWFAANLPALERAL